MPEAADLSPLEQRVAAAAMTGDWVDCEPAGAGEDDLENAAAWGPKRTVRASVIADALTSAAEPAPRAVRLRAARITGKLELGGLQLRCPLILERCRFERSVELAAATAATISLFNCRCRSIGAQGLHVAGDLRMGGAHMSSLSLYGAQIDGLLHLDECTIGDDASKGTVLSAEQLQVKQGVWLRSATVHGRIQLDAADIGRALTLERARIGAAKDDIALAADGVRIDKDLLAEDAVFTGSVRFPSAQIGGAARFAGLRVDCVTRPALHAYRIRVADDLTLSRAELNATLNLESAEIGGSLVLSGASLRDESGQAVNGKGLHAGRDVVGRDGFATAGAVCLAGAEIQLLDLREAGIGGGPDDERLLDLEGARVGTLRLPRPSAIGGGLVLAGAQVGVFDDGTGGDADARPPQPLQLAGLTYESLAGPSSVSTRLRWLEAAETEYLPQGYDQLVRVLRRSGRDEDAAVVVIAGQRRKRRTLRPAGRLWSRFLDLTVGYGHRVGRAVLCLAILVAIGWLVFSQADAKDLIASKPHGVPAFNPFLYSLDAVLPIIDLGQQSSWAVKGGYQWVLAGLVILGWILAAEVIAALTNTLAALFKRD